MLIGTSLPDDGKEPPEVVIYKPEDAALAAGGAGAVGGGRGILGARRKAARVDTEVIPGSRGLAWLAGDV